MKQKLLLGLLIGIAASAALLFMDGFGLLTSLENDTWNRRVRFFNRYLPDASTHTDQIKLILLDQESLDWAESESGLSWPWPRQIYVPILDFCKRAGAKGVAFDVLYTENSAYSVEDDESMGQAVRDGAPFTLALFQSHSDAKGAAKTWPEGWQMPDWPIAFESSDDEKQWVQTVKRPAAYFPISRLATNTTSLGNVAEEPDQDGVFRRVHFFKHFDGNFVPSLGLGLYLQTLEHPGLSVSGSCIYIAGAPYPVTSDMSGIIRYQRPDAFEKFSAAAIIQSEVRLQSGENPVIDPARLKDTYVLFGFSAPGLKDLRPTPLSPVAPGVMIHANFLENLLQGSLMKEAASWVSILLILLLSVLGGTLVLVSRKASTTAVLFVILLSVPAALAFLAYHQGLWLPLAVPESALLLSMVIAVIVSFATEGRQKMYIKRAFRHYLSPDVIEKILENPDALKLGGERRTLSIYFSDIAGFSSFSERLDPEKLTAFLNDYLSAMTDIIQDHGGTVDKYIGDAIVAFWNAPLEQADHALLATRAAVACQACLSERRAEYLETYQTNLQVRIGINTGEVTVGNMGSSRRFDYSILGDAANLASRLEGVNKVFGTDILISEDTWNRLDGQIPGREVGRVTVVGRSRPVTVYQLFVPGDGLPGPDRPAEAGHSREGDRQFMDALQLCYAGKWKESLPIFHQLGNDPTAKNYVAMLEKLSENEDWDGTWSLTSK